MGPILASGHAILRDDDTGAVLLSKNADTIVPIASLAKLMTAMVVLDSKPDMAEMIRIETADVDTLKHSASRVPVGTTLSRRDLMAVALMSSDNRAAHALARAYPGGDAAFQQAIHAKIRALGLGHTSISDPTGLSPSDTSTALDLATIADAASRYPEITRITTGTERTLMIKGRPVLYHNTNALVGRPDWRIGLSKTGFTNEAGRCVVMRFEAAGRRFTMVLLNAGMRSAARTLDAVNVRRFLHLNS
jgi:D-alanyl-D-alanine carboxypeptidase/D-alanyl-D-alanine endopeptidase (penicillin-binding protein 7)